MEIELRHTRIKYRKCENCERRVKRLPKDCLPEDRYRSCHKFCKGCCGNLNEKEKENDRIQESCHYKCPKCNANILGTCMYCRQSAYWTPGIGFICGLCL